MDLISLGGQGKLADTVSIRNEDLTRCLVTNLAHNTRDGITVLIHISYSVSNITGDDLSIHGFVGVLLLISYPIVCCKKVNGAGKLVLREDNSDTGKTLTFYIGIAR